MKFVAPSKVKGRVVAPPSKSMMGRAVAAALLADGTSRIANASFCDDALAALAIMEALGAQTHKGKNGLLTIHGTGKRALNPKGAAVDSHGLTPVALNRNLLFSSHGEREGEARTALPGEGVTRAPLMDCGESGLCMRMFAPIAALQDKEVMLLASGSLRSRPMGMVEELGALGVSCRTDHGHPPILLRGPMKGGRVRIDASETSQFLTGLLMALPLCEEDSLISVSGLKSTPYVLMTMELLKQFGVSIGHDEGLEQFFVKGNQMYQPSTYAVEGDWSGAAFLLVAGATSGSVTVAGLNLASAQADRAILDILQSVGASVKTADDHVSVEKNELKPFQYDATDCPDLFPPLVALASSCEGNSVIYGVGRLAHKESDRARALASEFAKLGIIINTVGDSMEVYGGNVRKAIVDAHNDHRIAMACAVAALRAEGSVCITGEACVSKSYPGFFSDLEALSASGGPV